MIDARLAPLIARLQRYRIDTVIGLPYPEADANGEWLKFAEVEREVTALLTEQQALAQLAYGLQREKHQTAVDANPMFSVLHWKHHAGVDWPDVDDGSYTAFENCEYPDCKLVRAALVDQEPRPQLLETKDDK